VGSRRAVWMPNGLSLLYFFFDKLAYYTLWAVQAKLAFNGPCVKGSNLLKWLAGWLAGRPNPPDGPHIALNCCMGLSQKKKLLAAQLKKQRQSVSKKINQ